MITPQGGRAVEIYSDWLIGLTALLIALCGVAALGWGWLPSWRRRAIVRPRLFGWAQLTNAAALVVHLVGDLLIQDPYVRSTVTMSGAWVLVLGCLLNVQSVRPPRNRWSHTTSRALIHPGAGAGLSESTSAEVQVRHENGF